MSSWGREHYGDPCRECGYKWSLDIEQGRSIIAAAPAHLSVTFRGSDGSERIPELDWPAVAYVCHLVDNLRIWSERLVGAARGGGRLLTTYDANLLAVARSYEAVDLQGALWSLGQGVHDWQDAVDEANAASVQLIHPERGVQTVADTVRNNAHDVFHHEWDIERLVHPSQ